MTLFVRRGGARKLHACSAHMGAAHEGVAREGTTRVCSSMPRMLIFTGLLMGLGVGARSAAAEPGDHIGTDTVQLIPSAELSLHRRTNVYLEEGETGGGPPVSPGTALWIQPDVTFKLDGSDVTLQLGAHYAAKKYFQSAVGTENSTDVANLSRYKDFGLRGNLVLLKNSMVGLKLRNSTTLSGSELEEDDAENPYLDLLRIQNSGRITVRPGSSLDVDLGGDFNYSTYTFLSGDNLRVGYGPAAEAKWKFLPKTAVVGSWSMEWFDWRDNFQGVPDSSTSTSDVIGSYLGVPDGRLARLEGGLRGRLTERLVLGLTIGYGTAIYDEQSVLDDAATEPGGDQELDPVVDGFGIDLKGLPDGLLSTVSAAYSPVESQTFSISYRKDFQDVVFSNYVAFHRVRVGYSGMFADRYGADLSFSYRNENYDGETDRTDHRLIGNAAVRYVATRYLDATAGITWKRRASADQLNPDIEYDDVDFHAGVTFTY